MKKILSVILCLMMLFSASLTLAETSYDQTWNTACDPATWNGNPWSGNGGGWFVTLGAEGMFQFARLSDNIYYRKAVSTRKRNEKLLFTGLIKCGVCGRTLVTSKRRDRDNDEYIKRCWYQDPLGIKCMNRGVKIDELYAQLIDKLKIYENELNAFISHATDDGRSEAIERRMKTLKGEMSKRAQVLNRIMHAYEEGLYTTEQFKERKIKAEKALDSIKLEIISCEKEIALFDTSIAQGKISVLQSLYDLLEDNTVSDEIKNRSLQKIVNRITWHRVGDEATRIEFSFY